MNTRCVIIVTQRGCTLDKGFSAPSMKYLFVGLKKSFRARIATHTASLLLCAGSFASCALKQIDLQPLILKNIASTPYINIENCCRWLRATVVRASVFSVQRTNP